MSEQKRNRVITVVCILVLTVGAFWAGFLTHALTDNTVSNYQLGTI